MTRLAPVLATAALLASCAGTTGEHRADFDRDAAERVGIAADWRDRAVHGVEAALADGELGGDEAVALALAHNARLRAILARLDVADADRIVAALPANPRLEIEWRFVEDGPGDVLELALARRLLDLVLLPLKAQISAARFERVRAEVAGAVIDLATETRAAYRELQARQDLIELETEVVDATYWSLEASRRLHAAGNVIAREVAMERARHEESKLALAEAHGRAAVARENLNLLMGVWGEQADAWSVRERLPQARPLEVDPARLEAKAIASSLDLAAAHARILALGREAGLERLDALLPEASAGVAAEKEADDAWSVGPTVELPLPMFDLGQAAATRAQARLRRAYHLYGDVAQRVRREARAAWFTTTTHGGNARFLREVVLPARAEVTEQTRLQFNAMHVDVRQLLEARRQEAEAGRRHVDTLRRHWIARGRLEAILMGRLPAHRFGVASGFEDEMAERGGDASDGEEDGESR